MFKGLLAPQLGKVIMAKGFTTLRVFFPRSVTVIITMGFTELKVFLPRSLER